MFKDELSLLIRARYPVVWLRTTEESRVLRIVKAIAKEQVEMGTAKTVMSWSATKGLVLHTGDKVVEQDPETAIPVMALKVVGEEALKGARTLFVFLDLHTQLNRDPSVYRALKDLYSPLKASKCTVLIVSPDTKTVPELDTLVSFLDVPLPTKEELRPIVEDLMASAGIPVPKNGEFYKALENLQGLTEAQAENVVARSIVAHKALNLTELVKEKEAAIRASGVLQFYQSMETMASVGGLDRLKTYITKRALAFTPKAQAFGVRPPRGVFLAGPPGTGKTLTAKAMAAYLGYPLAWLEASKIFGQFVGQSEQSLASALKVVAANAPCVLFIDEAEKLFAGTSGPSSSDVTAKLAGMFLTWMQERPAGADKVMVVMTANNVLSLPPELFSRFDATFWVNLPNYKERCEIFRIHIAKVKRDPDKFNLVALSTATEGYSGREIEKLVAETLYTVMAANPEDPREVTTEDIVNETKGVKPLSETRKADLDKLREWGTNNATPANEPMAEGAARASRGLELS
jgi:ATP-dependent 26S proteasome regulatory subunit